MAEGRLTTHVLDTARGKPAAGVKIMLYRVSGNSHRKITEAVTNADGRTDAPLLSGKALTEGQYELVFCAGDYLRTQGALTGDRARGGGAGPQTRIGMLTLHWS